LEEPDNIARLADYCLEHYYPSDARAAAPAVAVLRNVVREGARLASEYIASGFVHGVLNSDNIAITCESFDYGPWRFTPFWDGHFTAAYFDHAGLYSFGRQPEAIHWDILQLARALTLVAEPDDLRAELERFPEIFQDALLGSVFTRLGILPSGASRDAELLTAMETAMVNRRRDRPLLLRLARRPAGAAPPRRRGLIATEPSPSSDGCSGFERARGRHDYGRTRPRSMHIEEVEAIWSRSTRPTTVALDEGRGGAADGGRGDGRPLDRGPKWWWRAMGILTRSSRRPAQPWTAERRRRCEGARRPRAWRPGRAAAAVDRDYAPLRQCGARKKDAFADLDRPRDRQAALGSATEVDAVVDKVDISVSAYSERTSQRRLEGALGARSRSGTSRTACWRARPLQFPAHLPNGTSSGADRRQCLVFKPSEKTPGVGEFLVALYHEAGFPRTCALRPGRTRDRQAPFGRHRRYRRPALHRLGSRRPRLHRQFAETPQKILALELGGNNPLVIWGHARSIHGPRSSPASPAFLSAGQRCTGRRRLIVRDGAHEDIVTAIC
jgi:hypothetical protein